MIVFKVSSICFHLFYSDSDDVATSKMAKRKRLRTKSQLDQKVAKKLSESEKIAELSSSNDASDSETKVKTTSSSKKSHELKSDEKPNRKGDKKSSLKTADVDDDDERIRARVLLSSSDEEEEKGNSDRSSEAKKKRSDPRGQVIDFTATSSLLSSCCRLIYSNFC